ncbi:Coiled-coil domain-containing protein 96 [Caenorhabditis elegans]|uniref:Coiled-coil domain-containing protein 96 n=2 Tax=Caenorhabditis elegans TaxID=6239 RepID=H2KZ08_CAEEL|nr:Coiled-coil domain-containing protein 96 [Caenorhabditis elegans]CCD65641.2 Coiled-coil domain-containing protein 96 [Caenorhabditis elegans]
MSTSTTVKRARVTARIAQAENTSLPTSSEITQQLLEQTEGKRKQLDKKCGEYEQLCKKTAKLKAEKSRLDVESTQLTAQSDEIDQSFTKVEQNAEASFLLQQQKNNEMNEAVQQWAAVDVKEEKLYVDLTHETELEKQFKERYDEITRNLELLGAEAGSDEKLYYQMESAFDNDMRTEKTLEQYLTRLIDDVFVNQRRLEDIQIGTSRGRANFRQAEKALRDQRTRHRRLSSQITGTTVHQTGNILENNDTEKDTEIEQKLTDLGKAWALLEDKIRLKEFELAEESKKVHKKLAILNRQHSSAAADDDKRKQLRIAKDYADLQSLTPMYAAYTATLSLNHNLSEKLNVPKNLESSLKESELSKFSSKLTTPDSVLDFKDAVDEFPDYTQMSASRKKILRDTEHEAQRVLNHELKQLEGTVSGQRQETQALGKDVKWLKENIQLRQADIRFYTSKTEELIEKAKKEDQEKLTLQQKSQKSGGLLSADIFASRGDVLELREKRLIMENERNLLTNQIKENSLECDRLNSQWMILKGFAKSVDFDTLRQLNGEVEHWKLKVNQLQDQIEKLQKMENYASLANGQLRTNLALLKPYDEEYQEFESLVETKKQLNSQLARQEFKKSVEKLKQDGDIEIIF